MFFIGHRFLKLNGTAGSDQKAENDPASVVVSAAVTAAETAAVNVSVEAAETTATDAAEGASIAKETITEETKEPEDGKAD